MKITSIDVFLVTIGQPSVPGSPWNPVVVRINTEDGISGYGEVGLAYGDTKESAVGMCRDFAKLIIGMDAMNNEAIWARLHNTFWGLGGGPVVYGAMSAIDIALWDIKGKDGHQEPLHHLCQGLGHGVLRHHEVWRRAFPGERRTRRHAGHRLAHRQVGQSDHRGRPGSL